MKLGIGLLIIAMFTLFFALVPVAIEILGGNHPVEWAFIAIEVSFWGMIFIPCLIVGILRLRGYFKRRKANVRT